MSGEEAKHASINIYPENDQAEGSAVDSNLQSYPLALMVRVTKIQRTPLPKCLFTENIIHEVFDESVSSEYQINSVDILNEYEFLLEIAPPSEMLCSSHEILMTWLGIELQVFCALAETNVLREVLRERKEES